MHSPMCAWYYIHRNAPTKRKDENDGARRLTMLLHASKELDDDLGGRTDQDLSPSALFSVGDCFKAIGEY